MFGTARGHVGRWSAAIGRAMGDLLYPDPCVVCEGEGDDGPFCEACRGELREAGGPACPRCAQPVGPFANLDGGCSRCRSRRLGFDAAIALGPYEGPIRHLCLQMKHLRGAWLARGLADVLVEARGEAIRQAGASAVVAVPLHWRRRWERGYNQADALADHLARNLGLPRIGGLRRVVSTAKLADLGRVERAKVLRRSFRSRPGPALAGRSILLIDDILTTGATCGAAARALKRGGARRVIAVVVGRA